MTPTRAALGCAWLLCTLTGCGGAAPAHAPTHRASPPSVITVEGQVVVRDLAAVRYTPSGAHCVTVAPYADIGRGTRVTVRNTSGLRVAVGTLGPGRLRNGPAARAGCSFGFDMSNVPGGSNRYSVRVARRPAVLVPEERIDRVLVSFP